MHRHAHLEATYVLRVHQFVTQQAGKVEGTNFTQHKMRNEFHSTQNEYAQTCSFKGNLRAESAPVHNTASG